MELYGSRTVGYWERLLSWPRPAVSRFALRALAQLGEAGAAALLRSAPRSPEASWALARTGQVAGCPLARLMTRRYGQPEPMRRLRQAHRLLPAFYWASQLTEREITPLVDLLRHTGNPAVLAACAWALGRLGRAVLPECLDACRQAALPTRRRFCRVFWYLGPEAHEASEELASWLPEPEAEAALLALEEAGSVAMVRAFQPDQEQYPVWLDQAAVDELACLAFGEALRLEAVRALGGFGPAREAAVRLLLVLADDRDRAVGRAALESLVASGHAQAVVRLLREDPQATVLRSLPPHLWLEHLYGRDEDAQLQALWRCRPLELSSRHWERLHELRLGGVPAVRLAALRVLVAIPLAHGPWVREALADREPEARRLALTATLDRKALEAALSDPDREVRRTGARQLLQHDRTAFARVLLHPDPDVRGIALEEGRNDSFLLDITRRLWQTGEVNPTMLELLGPSGQLLCQALARCAPRHRLWLARELARSGDVRACHDLLKSSEAGRRRSGAAALRFMAAGLSGPLPFDLLEWAAAEPSWSVRTLLLVTARLLQAREVEAFRRRIEQRDPAFLAGWKHPLVEVRLLVREALLEQGRVPPDMEACLSTGQHHTREGLDAYLQVGGLEAFRRMARRSLHHLDAPGRLLLARRLGALDELEVLADYRRENPEEGHRLLDRALRESEQALVWLARTGAWCVFPHRALEALREERPFSQEFLSLLQQRLQDRSASRRPLAVWLLAAAGFQPEPGLLARLRQDPDDRVRRRAWPDRA